MSRDKREGSPPLPARKKRRRVSTRQLRIIARLLSSILACILVVGVAIIRQPAAQGVPDTRTLETNVVAYSRQVDLIADRLASWSDARDALDVALLKASGVIVDAGTSLAQVEVAALDKAIVDGRNATTTASLLLAVDRINTQVAAVASEIASEQAAEVAKFQSSARSASSVLPARHGLRNARTIHVGSSAYAGEQSIIDKCQGATDLTNWYGKSTIAQHWHCGGNKFPRQPGSIIALTGLWQGVWEVGETVAMVDYATATTEDVPAGHELLYQTCLYGSPSTMVLISLHRIG